LNNNRTNRRRGRGNRNQGGNGNQLNRIDSRARGNAPQLLDKYKKLAQDAHHNGDRVQMEYYLQFADHYFRVIADNKARQDEARGGGRRNDEREMAEDFGDDDFDFDTRRRSERTPRYRPEESFGESEQGSVSASEEGEYGQEGEAFAIEHEPAPEQRRRQRKPREEGRSERRDDKRADRAASAKPVPPGSGEEKPAARGRKPRKMNGGSDHGEAPAGIDQAVLPPSIRSEEGSRVPPASDGDGTLEAVG
jgi:hypothetical protein